MVKQIVAPAAALLAPPGGQVAVAGDGANLALPQPDDLIGKAALSTLQNAEQVVRINDLAEGNPKQAAAVLRGWMAQG
jgi:flagellar biosynthesis/type III secretory pathway M-ring protein FliF/YscJ